MIRHRRHPIHPLSEGRTDADGRGREDEGATSPQGCVIFPTRVAQPFAEALAVRVRLNDEASLVIF